MADDNDWKNLSTLDKIEHKNWKARVEGYEAALRELRAADDPKDPRFNPYTNIAKKMVIDSNAMAQEKALEVVEVFVAECSAANRTAFEVVPGLILKAVSATRAKTREKAIEILKLYIEAAEKQDIVVDELVKGLSLKAPKSVAGCILCLREALHEFGPKIVPIKELFKHVPKLLEDRDKTVRESGKELIVEMFRWVGRAPLESMLAQIKVVQVTELTTEFEKIQGEPKPTPTRYLRSQKPKEIPAKAVGDAGGTKGGEIQVQEDNEPDIDPYELIDPVEVIRKIPSNFYQKIEEKKWTERKEALEEIDKLTNHPKLVPGDYADLVKTIQKVIAKDTNVVLVALGAKIIAQIAAGIRDKFSPYALDTLKIGFEKFKERKMNVVKAVRDCVDAAYVTTKLDLCAEEIQTAAGHKTPAVRNETICFVNRIVERNKSVKQEQRLNKKNIKLLVNLLIKSCADNVPEVRESSFQALGTAMAVLGEKQVKPLIEIGSVDAVKMSRITECYEKFKSGGGVPDEAQVISQKPPPAAPVQSPPPSSTVTAPKEKTGGPPKRAGAAAKKPQPKTVLTNKGKGKNGDGPAVPTEPTLSEDEAIIKMNEMIGEDTFVDKLTDKNYKERLAAMEKMQSFVNEKDSSNLPGQVINRVLCVKPGLKDNNIMVLKMKIDVIKTVVTKSNRLTWTAVEFCIPDLTEKIGDIKNSALVKSTLTEMSEILDVGMVAEQVIKTASDNVNVKNIIETLNWLGESLQEFGYRIPVEKMLPFTKITLSHNSPIVRQASIKLVGVVSLFMRDAIGKMLESEKVSIKQLIDAEIENMKNIPTPVPVRGLKSAPGGAAGDVDVTDSGGGKNAAVEKVTASMDMDAMIPRDDVSNKVTETLVNKFADKSWKVKKEGYETVTSILTGHAGLSGEGFGNLLTAIAKNSTDSSAVVKKMALEALVNIGKLFSKQDCVRHARAVLPGILASCADAKPKNREESLTALNLWTDKIGFNNCCDGGMLTDAMKMENPYLRATLITWMTPHLKACGESRELKKSLYVDFGSEIMGSFFSSLEDRSPDVRKAAQECLVPLMTVLGFDQMFKYHTANTKLASRENIKQFLEKAKEQMPKAVTKPQTAVKKDPQSTVSNTASTKKEPVKKEAAVKGKAAKEDKVAAAATADSSGAQGPVVSVLNKSSNKKQRINDDRKKKLTQWEPNSMNIQQLESQFQGNCSPDLYSLLFSKDFKNYIKAIDMLSGFLNEQNEDSIDATLQNLDIILKWSVIRFNETNPSVIFKCLDYLNKVFNVLRNHYDKKFQLHDQEAMSFLPDLCSKLGDSKDQVRNSTRSLLNTILTCYPENKISQFLEIQLESKVARVRQESTDFLRAMIDDRRLDVFNHRGLLKSIGQLVGERDNSVRTAALNCLVSAHNFMGEDLLNLLYKTFTQKEKDMLEERIKRTGKPAGQSSDTASTITTTTATTRDSSNSRLSTATLKASKNGRDSSIGSSRLSSAPGAVSTTTQGAPAPIDVNPLLKEDISNKLFDLQKEIEEINQPLPELKLRYSGRTNQTLNASEAIRGVISDISDSDTEKSIGAMAQIDEVIRNQDVCGQLTPHVEKLMQSICMKLSVTVSKLSEEPYNESEITDVFRVILATLMSIFGVKDLATQIPRGCLMELMERLLNTVISEQLVSMADGSGVVRGINVLSVRILDSSDQTNMLSCLLRLMTECLRKGDYGSKFLHLLFKCIWSMTKNLNNTIKSINLLMIMKDINIFFVHFPPSKWESSQKDVPMRTVKTLIHSLITHNQGGILETIYMIPNGPNKELDSYIRKSYTKLKLAFPAVLPNPPAGELASTRGPNSTNYQPDFVQQPDYDMIPFIQMQRDGGSDCSKENRMLNDGDNVNLNQIMRQQQQQLQDTKYSSAHSNKRPYLEDLKQIFCKIGQPDETEQGLNDLFDFKSKYPYVDLDRYLRQTSGYFQKTIETGLKEIAAKRYSGLECVAPYFNNQSNNNGVLANASSQQPNTNNNEDSWVNCSMDPDSLFKRLKNLRQRVGLDNTLNNQNTDVVVVSSQRAVIGDTVHEMDVSEMNTTTACGDGPAQDKLAAPKPNRRMSSDELATYRQRIAKIGKPLK